MIPVVKPHIVNRLNGGFTEVVIKCPYCDNEHRHSGEGLPGNRSAHCADNMTGKRQYYIQSPD